MAPTLIERWFPAQTTLVMAVLFCAGWSGKFATAAQGQTEAVLNDAAWRESFEREIRPLLVERCQSCHGPEQQKAGLRLDSREALLRGGDSGPAVELEAPEASLLIEAVRQDGFLRMPPKSKLTDVEIAALTRWVENGAPWPGSSEPSTPAVRAETFNLAERALHWSFQPVQRGAVPGVADEEWPRNPIDAFLLARLEAEGLKPAPDADRRTWLRRVTYDLTGLPPSLEEITEFLDDTSPDQEACAKVVDWLLASPRYGERWARHWLDLVRYAETAGHEFDYDLPNAWRYRDYVVRALNADVPFDQFVIEHLAGDLLDQPRRDPVSGFNESVLGTGFLRLHEGTHSPVDLLDDEAARLDNQIDVLSKAFLGLTVACARCHDHKFDAITQRDYYAMAGFLRSTRHQLAFLDPTDRQAETRSGLQESLATLQELLRPVSPGWEPDGVREPIEDGIAAIEVFEDFRGDSFADWAGTGAAFGDGPTTRETLRLALEREDFDAKPTAEVIPAGWAHSGVLSTKLSGVLRSRTFTIEKPYIHVFAAGRRGRINVVVDGFEKIRDPIYGGLTVSVDAGSLGTSYTIDVRMWRGHRAYIELADGAVVDFQGAESRIVPSDGYLAVDDIVFSDSAAPPEAPRQSIQTLAMDPTDPKIAAFLRAYRRFESLIEPPVFALAVVDGTGEDVPLHIRGSTKNLGDPVPRRFLEVFQGPIEENGNEGESNGSGRWGLAAKIADPANPLTARVLVNRVWAHHFGRGLVATPDDFGRMGQPPTHPELLDWLAAEFVEGGWSLKALHRSLLLSRAYRMSSVGAEAAAEVDPENRLRHRMPVRRLEAEAIRDAMLSLAGRLDETMGGQGIPPYLTPFLEGRGRPAESGPMDGQGRRSLYLQVRRNFLPPMLLAFDFPTPTTTIGRRHVSNVPAQALTLLNDPFVVEQAQGWAARVLADPTRTSAEDRLEAMYLAAFARRPTRDETNAALGFLGDSENDLNAWAALAHVLFNVKEFIFVR